MRSSGEVEQKKTGYVTRFLLVAVRGYQRFLSPVLPSACRFHPTCSEYMYQAISKWGALKGFWLGLKRIGRCHPWNPGGFDPVP